MNIGFVRGILPVHQMTAIEAHKWICGFAAVSGRDFPVVDLRAKLGIAHGSHGREPFIIVVETRGRLVGFIADRVSEDTRAARQGFSKRSGADARTGATRAGAGSDHDEEDWSALRIKRSAF